MTFKAHKKTRVAIEQMFGRWKRRFYILHAEMRVKYDRAPMLIACCAVLHNIAVKHNLPDFEEDLDRDDVFEGDNVLNVHNEGTRFRNFIVNQFFNS